MHRVLFIILAFIAYLFGLFFAGCLEPHHGSVTHPQEIGLTFIPGGDISTSDIILGQRDTITPEDTTTTERDTRNPRDSLDLRDTITRPLPDTYGPEDTTDTVEPSDTVWPKDTTEIVDTTTPQVTCSTLHMEGGWTFHGKRDEVPITWVNPVTGGAWDNLGHTNTWCTGQETYFVQMRYDIETNTHYWGIQNWSNQCADVILDTSMFVGVTPYQLGCSVVCLPHPHTDYQTGWLTWYCPSPPPPD